jgi:hypothetical protein
VVHVFSIDEIRSNQMRYAKGFLLLLFVVLLAKHSALSQSPQTSAEGDNSGGILMGSLADLRTGRRILLLVRRSTVIDSRGQAVTIMSEAYRPDPDARLRYPRLFNSLARKLNNYINKYGTITAVKNIPDTDFIILFNLLEYRRSLGRPYPYGELFVILNDRLGGKPPRIVWKSRKSSMWAEDAIGDFIKDLKTVRGES